MNVKDYYKVYNVVPKDICDKIILEYENNPGWMEHQWYNSRENTNTSLHNVELSILYPTNFSYHESYLAGALNQYSNDTGVPTEIVSFYTAIRLNKYPIGKSMAEHTDLIRRGQHDGVPVLSMIIAFNDDYEGGKFIMNDEIVELKQVDILIFPSTFLYKHRVTEVTNGTRYSGVIWSY